MDTKNISVVVQGAILSQLTPICLQSIRTHFPGAEIILSTWEGSNVTDLDYDKLIFSPDPGTICCDEVAGTFNNLNRQLVSTQAGIRAATRPYILKTRTDIRFYDSNFTDYLGKFDHCPPLYLNNRLLVCNYFTRNPRVMPLCYHPSDWIVFGEAIDIQSYYLDTPLMEGSDGAWFQAHQKESTFFTNYLCRYTPEQYIFLAFLRRHKDVTCECYYDYTPQSIVETERSFAECFVILDYQKQFKIEFLKYNPNRYFEKHTLFSHEQWKAIYKHYCTSRPSLHWGIYCVESMCFKGINQFRLHLIKLFDVFGVKELVKRKLN